MHQADVVAEAHQEGAVARAQDGLEERFEIPAVGLDERVLAAADIDDQPEIEGHVGGGGEEGDFLRRAVFEDGEILLMQTGDQAALRVADGEGYVHQVDVHAKGSLGEGGEKQQGRAGELHHEIQRTGAGNGMRKIRCGKWKR